MEAANISKTPKDILMHEGYKYYCIKCGTAYEELQYISLKGLLTPKCSCGSNEFATLDGDKPLP